MSLQVKALGIKKNGEPTGTLLLIMKYKQFNQELHDICDPPAREAVTRWIEMKWGLQATPHPDKYAVDLVVHRSGKAVGYVEVEVRQPNLHQYETIHVAQRKEKLFQANLPTLFFVLTGDLTHAFWTKTEFVLAAPLIEVKNTVVSEGEYFFDVPRKLFKYVDLTEPF